MHITEHTGRGIPKITEVYGRDNVCFNENSIVVTIPYDRLDEGVYILSEGKNIADEIEIPPVSGEILPVGVLTGMEIEDKILLFCREPKGILEIVKFLRYKDKKTVRKYLNPLIEQGRIARTIPDSPNSRFQKYVTIK